MSAAAAAYEEVLAPNHYFDKRFNVEAAKILPGEYYVSQRDMVLVTVLGSCVAACLRDPVAGVGGMNHFMLAGGGPNRSGDVMRFDSGRYGAYAMEVLVNQLLKLGARRERLEAKVFGGGSVLDGFTTTQVGRDNAAFVRGYLVVEGIPIVAEDLEDIHPRKVYFFPRTGRALVRKLKHMHNDTLGRREEAYRARLAKTRIAGDVELF